MSRNEKWSKGIKGVKNVVTFDVSDLETVALSYELLEELLKQLGWKKDEGSGNAATAHPDSAQGG